MLINHSDKQSLSQFNQYSAFQKNAHLSSQKIIFPTANDSYQIPLASGRYPEIRHSELDRGRNDIF
jgi:hypothetical protein